MCAVPQVVFLTRERKWREKECPFVCHIQKGKALRYVNPLKKHDIAATRNASLRINLVFVHILFHTWDPSREQEAHENVRSFIIL